MNSAAEVALHRKPPSDAEQDLNEYRKGRDLTFFDLHSIDQVTQKDLVLLFDVARRFRDYKTYKFSFNKGFSQVNAFFEPSTRTMASFDLAAKQLSMDTTSVSASASSTKKGESFIDTVETLAAYNVRAIVIRTSQAGAAEFAARHVSASVINAGDGWHEHPTQGLLDALTMLDEFGSKDLKGRVISIVGDVKHSRVFGSLVRILRKLHAEIRVVAPETFLPDHVENFGISTYWNIEEGLRDSDVIYALRVQEERGAKEDIPTLREYSKTFGITEKRLALAKKSAILMHPGPVMRDIDVHSSLVARHPQSRILRQVENGSAIRKALLWLICDRLDGKTKHSTLL
jgi:aspartate carbamoyltransferase catalytic subunit